MVVANRSTLTSASSGSSAGWDRDASVVAGVNLHPVCPDTRTTETYACQERAVVFTHNHDFLRIANVGWRRDGNIGA
jgi:hypothetical protein